MWGRERRVISWEGGRGWYSVAPGFKIVVCYKLYLAGYERGGVLTWVGCGILSNPLPYCLIVRGGAELPSASPYSSNKN